MHQPPLRRIRRITGALCLLPLAAGCFAYDTTVRLAPDGSGTVEQELVLTGTMAEMVRYARTAGEEEELDLCEASDLGEGVRLLSAEPIEEANRVGCRQVYAFTDINTLRLRPDLDGRLPEGIGPEEGGLATPEEPISFSFQRGSPSTLVVRMPQQGTGAGEDEETGGERAEEKAPEDAAGRAMALAMMREMLRGSRFSVHLVVAGEIVETDATYRDGGRITLMELDFDALLEDPEAFERLLEVDDPSPAAAKELLAQTPGVRIEPREEVVVRFR